MLLPTSPSGGSPPPNPKTRDPLCHPSQGPPTVCTPPRQIFPLPNQEHLRHWFRDRPGPLLQWAHHEPDLYVGRTHLRVPEIHQTSHSTQNLNSRRGTSIPLTEPFIPPVHYPGRLLHGQYCRIPISLQKPALLSIMTPATTSSSNKYHWTIFGIGKKS